MRRVIGLPAEADALFEFHGGATIIEDGLVGDYDKNDNPAHEDDSDSDDEAPPQPKKKRAAGAAKKRPKKAAKK